MCFCACLKAFILVKTSIKKMKAPAPIKLDEISSLLQQKENKLKGNLSQQMLKISRTIPYYKVAEQQDCKNNPLL